MENLRPSEYLVDDEVSGGWAKKIRQGAQEFINTLIGKVEDPLRVVGAWALVGMVGCGLLTMAGMVSGDEGITIGAGLTTLISLGVLGSSVRGSLSDELGLSR